MIEEDDELEWLPELKEVSAEEFFDRDGEPVKLTLHREMLSPKAYAALWSKLWAISAALLRKQ